jgi:molybdate transport system ATP-binding protein
VLEADVEVDRREFTVRAAIRVAPGERLALFGPSGAGKTTVLETIAGLVQPRRGRVTLGGRVLTSTGRPAVSLPAWRRQVGLLRQDPGLFPHLSVRDNLGYGRGAGSGGAESGGADSGGADSGGAELAELAAALGLAGLLPAMPARLSGGQQHRVALGRLLLAHCRALLLDEPYSGLDAALRRTLTGLVVTMVAERDVPAILVAHELADAQAFAHQLAVLEHGEVLQTGRPDEVVRRPGSRRVAELVGYLGFVPVTTGGQGEYVLAGPDEQPPGQRLTAGIHPDRVLPGAVPGRGLVLCGPLTASRPAGAGWEADILCAGDTVTVRLADRPVTDGGELTVTATGVPVFGTDGAAVTSGRPDPATEVPAGPAGPATGGSAGA